MCQGCCFPQLNKRYSNRHSKVKTWFEENSRLNLMRKRQWLAAWLTSTHVANQNKPLVSQSGEAIGRSGSGFWAAKSLDGPALHPLGVLVSTVTTLYQLIIQAVLYCIIQIIRIIHNTSGFPVYLSTLARSALHMHLEVNCTVCAPHESAHGACAQAQRAHATLGRISARQGRCEAHGAQPHHQLWHPRLLGRPCSNSWRRRCALGAVRHAAANKRNLGGARH